MSSTITLKVGQNAWLPALSVAEHVTAVEPRLKVLPDGREQDETRIPELSSAANTQEAVAVGVFPLVGESRSGTVALNGGHVKVGRVLSMLEIEN